VGSAPSSASRDNRHKACLRPGEFSSQSYRPSVRLGKPLWISPRSDVHHISRGRARSILVHRLKNCQASSVQRTWRLRARRRRAGDAPRRGSTLPCPRAVPTDDSRRCDPPAPAPPMIAGSTIAEGLGQGVGAGAVRSYDASWIVSIVERVWDNGNCPPGPVSRARTSRLLPGTLLGLVPPLPGLRERTAKCDEFRPFCASSACRAGS
jgi:hypothetical protein